MRVEEDDVTFDVFKAMDFIFEVHSCFRIDDLDLVVVESYIVKISKPPLDVCLTHSPTCNSKREEVSEHLRYIEASPSYHPSTKLKVEKQHSSSMLKPSIMESPKLGLKPLHQL